ncbi:MAG: SDR family NAD(P)-dependent oxidoreductase [Thioalkalivibrionaceae bacterium]
MTDLPPSSDPSAPAAAQLPKPAAEFDDALLERAATFVPDPGAYSDQVWLVTGTADGIGREVALAGASGGATIVLLDREAKRLNKVYDAIVDAGHPEPALVPLNLEGATVQDYAELADAIENNFGRLDALVWNAGWVGALSPARIYEPEVWLKVINGNLNGPFLLAQAMLGLLEAAEKPRIVVSEHDCRRAYWGAYAAAKAGVSALVDVLAHEYTESYKLIRVNGIDTGPVATRLRARHYPAENPNRLPTPAAAAAPYLFCLDDVSAPLSGAHLDLTGRLPCNPLAEPTVTSTHSHD